jgi:hypothetical protein
MLCSRVWVSAIALGGGALLWDPFFRLPRNRRADEPFHIQHGDPRPIESLRNQALAFDWLDKR